MSGKDQWVNLEKNPDFVGDEVKSAKRLGAADFECTFKKASLAGFRVRIIPVGDHAKYSPTETSRNENFCVRVTGTATNQADKTVKLEKDVFLTAAGGNEYKIQAKYKKKVVESGEVLQARRMLFYQVMHMKGVKTGDTSKMEEAYWQESKNYFIKMKKKGPDAEIDYQKTIIMGNGVSNDAFIKAAGKKFALKGLKPYAFAIAFVNYIAVPGDTTITRDININVPSKISSWAGEGTELKIKLNQFLWCGLVDDDDNNKRWLIGGTLSFVPDGSKPGEEEAIMFDRGDVTVAGPDYRTYGGKAEIKIRLKEGAISRKVFRERKGKWHIELKIKTVDGWINGFAYNGINLLAIANKAVWEDQGESCKAYTINHEVGHKVGMVATGVGRLPEKPPNLYGEKRGVNDQDHMGPHCQKGANWDATKPRGKRWSGSPQCVMFGADGIMDGGTYKPAPAEFCSDCEKAVRKLDLHNKTLVQTGFKVTIG